MPKHVHYDKALDQSSNGIKFVVVQSYCNHHIGHSGTIETRFDITKATFFCL